MTFAAFGAKMGQLRAEGRLIPLHLGDTWRMPPESALAAAALDELASHLYAPTPGLPALIEALTTREGIGTDQLLITPGATGALSIAAGALFEPGEEVVVLTPSWPLIFGILQRGGVVVRELPVGDDGWPAQDLPQRLAALVGPKTAGVYFCQPNNPVGFAYDAELIAAIGAVAAEHDLWLLVDEAYRDLRFDGPAPPIRQTAPYGERAVFVGSFSKSYGLAGHRVGWVSGPAALRASLLKVATHLVYHPSVSGQQMALGALAGDGYITDLVGRYAEAARGVCATLGDAVAHRAPQAGYYVWLDLRDRVETPDAALEWLGELLEQTGVSLAPGVAFGDDFARFARLCFTAVPPEQLDDAVGRVASFLR